jgi:hypothetical protein
MATNTTFSTLVQDISNYLERGGSNTTDETVFDQIPRFINAAERKIMQALKLQGTIEVLADNAGLTAGVSVIAKPDRWRQTISMWYGGGPTKNARTPIFPRAYEYCRTYWPDETQTAPPEFYADYDYQHWLVSPTPDQTYPLELLCYMQPEYLDAVNQTNFWTSYTPTLLLYSSLLESAPFLKADERLATWEHLRDFELQTLTGQDLQKIMDRAAERDKP